MKSQDLFSSNKPKLTIDILLTEAKQFCDIVSATDYKELYGVTDGKAVGTYVEHKFQEYLSERYNLSIGNSANGIDLPSQEISTDIKVTSIKQPQSSCPFKDAKQKIYGLGYNILLFVYDKQDNPRDNTARLNFLSCSYIEKNRTADYTITKRILEMLKDGANKEDILAFLIDRNIPADEITLNEIVDKIFTTPPVQGFLTISNALQWRLQYGRIVGMTEKVEGIYKLIDKIH